MKKSEAIFGMIRIPLDALAVAAALLLAYRLRQMNADLIPGRQFLDTSHTLPDLRYYLSAIVVPGMAVFFLLASALRLYSLRATVSAWREVGSVLIAVTLWLALLIAWYFLVRRELFFSRILLLHAVFFMALFLTAVRASLILLQRSFLREGIGRMFVVSVGSHPIVQYAKDTLQGDEHYAYLGHLQNLESLRRLAFQRSIDLVLQTDPNPDSAETISLIEYCRSHHLDYGFLPPVLADVPHQLLVEKLGLMPLIRFRPTPLDGWGRVMKRLFDIVVSALLLILLSPLLFLIALVIVVTGGFPILYLSTRVGQHGRRRIGVLKFRSMIQNADATRVQLQELNHRRDGPLFKIRNDPRVTTVGRVLRRFSLDELPQLWNVLAGQMSLVGPRPHLPSEVERYSAEQRRVFAVKPGITGLAQISGRSDLNFKEEMRLDLQYIEEWSILMDLWILWRTLFTVFGRKGAD
ncbi:MAG: Undecaprenyl-phosphate galactose phosphotransferase [Candidatus Peregrinibacteria bacterium Greene0416_19]|nr:MAG: Undecaprenyl-phosphate galactose phosphotransferase [Candidatus Peregrinibacteria bacterium Greene0416_19]